jgi:hypothetical protein
MDVGDSLLIWRISANVLNKQLQAANKEWSSNLRGGQGLTTPHHKQPACCEMLHRALDFYRFFGMGMIYTMENGHEIWNVEC